MNLHSQFEQFSQQKHDETHFVPFLDVAIEIFMKEGFVLLKEKDLTIELTAWGISAQNCVQALFV